MKELILLEPVFKSMIWGGNKLKEEFSYDIPNDKTGECWAISAHENGNCVVKGGVYQGKNLSDLWDNHKEIFGGAKGDVFPLLIKIIDANKDLSIQVHPDNQYAKIHEKNALGKTECWYILECDDDATIVVGHNAKNKDELKSMIDKGQWGELIQSRPIKKGDFFQIEAGTVHAIKAGTMLLEIQQSSDITYRLYDYDRLDNGKKRELHLDKSIDVIATPHVDYMVNRNLISHENYQSEELIDSPYYKVKRIILDGKQEFNQNELFLMVSMIDGEGKIDDTKVKKGDHFIIPYGYGSYRMEGKMEFIISHI